MTDASAARPFDERASDEALDDLRRRLVATRWPDDPADAGWSLGTDVDYLRDLVAYWADDFDWRAQEATLARLPRFRSTVDGLSIHFVHARAAAGSDRALPLILNHGWPDSFWRYTKVIDLLTEPAAHGGDPGDAFDVIVPDMPGYGYSETPEGAALDSKAVAALWASMMEGLGYSSFVTAGGDIGSGVSRYLALDFPSRVRAVHRTDAGLPTPDQDTSLLTEPERKWLDEAAHWSATEGAYNAMHRTKPQTAAFGLTDSPVGLAAWIIEKLRSWSERGLDAYTRDEILTLVTMYWLTGTIGSSMRMYNANASTPVDEQKRFVEVPSGFTVFPGDITHPPREWTERVANTVRVTEAPRGGHFAAFEEPEVYVSELREFFRPFRG